MDVSKYVTEANRCNYPIFGAQRVASYGRQRVTWHPSWSGNCQFVRLKQSKQAADFAPAAPAIRNYPFIIDIEAFHRITRVIKETFIRTHKLAENDR